MNKRHKNIFTMKVFDNYSCPITKRKGTMEDLQSELKQIRKKYK